LSKYLTETDRDVKHKKREKSVKSAKSSKTTKSAKSGDNEAGCFTKLYQTVCPCIARKKEPELMEYESGSQAID
jgi:hypothetical protein